VAKLTGNPTESGEKPRIHVTRNGEIYVTAEDVVKSKKFQEQVKEMAKICVTRGPSTSS
jgi:hypothetical protein